MLLSRIETTLLSQCWQSDVNTLSKCFFIIECIKLIISLRMLDVKLLRSLVNFRMCNNVLPIERGRWLRQDINNRRYTLCNTNEVDDECHYIFKCLLH